MKDKKTQHPDFNLPELGICIYTTFSQGFSH